MTNDLEQILKKYLEYYNNEREGLKQLEDFIQNNEDIYNGKNTIGHITASGFVYSLNDKKILLLGHKKLNKLLQPGGHIEKEDDSLLEAAEREIYEETKLKGLELVSVFSDKNVPFDINTHYIPENLKKDMPPHYHHDFRYLFIVENSSEIVIDEAESNGYKWVDINQLKANSRFERVINKIFDILNTDQKIIRYYNKIIEKFDIDLREYNSIVVSHIIPDCVEYLESLNYVCPIQLLIPKPNSIDEDIFNKLSGKLPITKIKREEIITSKVIETIIKSSDKKIIIFDIGGYFAEYVAQRNDLCQNIKCIIEDTENGYQKYENIDTSVEIISVARSSLKENEDYLVGESIVFSAETLLREVGTLIEYNECGIIGFGKIGASIGRHLLQKGIKPLVYDSNPIKQIEACNRMCNIKKKKYVVENSDVLFLSTGNHSLNILDFRNVKKGAYIFSVTSSDDEINSKYLESEYKVTQISSHIYKYENECNYFYLVRKGNAVNFVHKAVMYNFIHLVRSEMLVAAKLMIDGKIKVGEKISEVDVNYKKEIAKVWLEIFQNGNY